MHEHIANPNVHWSVRCELARRGGIRSGKGILPTEVDGVARQIIEENQRAAGNQKEVGAKTTWPNRKMRTFPTNPPNPGVRKIDAVPKPTSMPVITEECESPGQESSPINPVPNQSVCAGAPSDFQHGQFAQMESA